MYTLFAALSALTYGFADFSGGLAARKSPVSAVVAWSQAIGIPVAVLAAPLIGTSIPTMESWMWGAAAGLSGALGLGFLYKGLAEGYAGVVSPTSAVTGAVLPVLFGFISGERPGVLSWTGVLLALPAVFLLTWEKNENKGIVRESLRDGLVAGLGFGGFFILLAQTGELSGLWPLVAARTTSVPMLLIVTLVRRRSLALSPGSRISALGAGVLDMLANIFFLLSSRSGLLIIVAVITALYPAPTVLLHWIVLKEKLGVARIVGLAMALAGIALIGMS
jgi:drug/metabolite transporter (DMT)-like permease